MAKETSAAMGSIKLITCTSPIPAQPNFTSPPESLLGAVKV
jgi:hypothetical protein